MTLSHSATFVISLRGRVPGEEAGFLRIEVSEASAADVLEWIEVPLHMLRAQASADTDDGTQADVASEHRANAAVGLLAVAKEILHGSETWYVPGDVKDRLEYWVGRAEGRDP